MKLPKRRSLRILIGMLTLLVFAGGVYGTVWWLRYPSAPDPNAAPFADAVRYMGSDEFGQLTQRHQKRYALSVIERSRQMPFKELVSMMMSDQENRKAAAKHINQLPEKDKDDIGAAFIRVAMDNFFSQSRSDQQAYLMSLALAEKAAKALGPSTRPTTQPAGRKGDEWKVPSPEQLEKEMAKFLSTQPPRTVAQMSQFMSDLRRTREFFGLR
jgi:hypothetical protein